MIQAEETISIIFTDNYLIPKDYLCATSILNVTDATIEMPMPQIIIEEIMQYGTEEIN